MELTRADIAGFYQLAMHFGRWPASRPIAWADSEIEKCKSLDIQIIDLSLAQGKPVDAVIDALRQISRHPTHRSFGLYAG